MTTIFSEDKVFLYSENCTELNMFLFFRLVYVYH